MSAVSRRDAVARGGGERDDVLREVRAEGGRGGRARGGRRGRGCDSVVARAVQTRDGVEAKRAGRE